jgi:hypothetical protein
MAYHKWFPKSPDFPGWKQRDPMLPIHAKCGFCVYGSLPIMVHAERIGTIPGKRWPHEFHPLNGSHAVYEKALTLNEIYAKPLPLP